MKHIGRPNRFAIALLATAFFVGTPTLASGKPQEVTKPKKSEAKAVAAIRAVMDAQAAAWNRGDLEAFMDGYWRSNEILFISGNTVTYGWQTVLDRYKKGYETREKMGTLLFSNLEFKLLSKDAAVVNGSWELTRANDKPHGRFTLIFRRKPEGWRIVHDHTSE